MSIVIQEDELKGLPDQILAQELEVPSGNFPPYLVFAELDRRKDLRERYAQRQSQAPASTMAEEMVAEVSGMGMPQQQMPMQMMRDGGIVGYSNGGPTPTEEQLRAIMSTYGIDRDQAVQVFQQQNAPSNPSRGGQTLEANPRLPRNGLVINRATPAGNQGGEGSPSAWRGYFGAGADALSFINENVPYMPGYVPSSREELVAAEGAEKEPADTGTGISDRSGLATQGGMNLTRPIERSEPSYLDQFQNFLSQYNNDQDNSDLDSFKSLIEQYNPRPSKNVAQGKMLAEIGRGLLSAPTFGEGLAAGIPGAVDAISEQQGLMADYNRNKLAAESALMQTKEARRKSREDMQYRGRTSLLSANVDRETAGQRLNILRADSVNDDIDRLDVILNDQTYNLDDEQRVRLEREREMLVKRKRSLVGTNRERLAL